MLNVQKLAATSAMALIAAGSLAAVAPGTAGATATSTTKVGPIVATTVPAATSGVKSLDAIERGLVCAHHEAILQVMVEHNQAYSAVTTHDSALAKAARADGNLKEAHYLRHEVDVRNKILKKRLLRQATRRAHLKAVDEADGITC
ncbi:MAG: hypothetical protein ABSB09_12225 [Acidimicrobiales bacterium]|jgi:hypothetical protein